MTKTELAAALRARFRALRHDLPGTDIMAEALERAPDERVIRGHLRCAACRREHVSYDYAIGFAESFTAEELDQFLSKIQEKFIAAAPAKCVERIRDIERGIQGLRPA